MPVTTHIHHDSRWTLCCLAMLFAFCLAGSVTAQEAEVSPIGRFITLESPLTDQTLGLVRRTALELQSIAETEDRKAYLILDLKAGTTEFHNAFAMADFLAGSSIHNVTTVVWVSETVTGNNVLVALACNEIVLSPDAMLGDMGRGNVVA